MRGLWGAEAAQGEVDALVAHETLARDAALAAAALAAVRRDGERLEQVVPRLQVRVRIRVRVRVRVGARGRLRDRARVKVGLGLGSSPACSRRHSSSTDEAPGRRSAMPGWGVG